MVSAVLAIVSFYMIYSEQQYFTLIIVLVAEVLGIVVATKRVQLNTILYYILIIIGYSFSIIGSKVFVVVSIVIANIIDVYLLGVLVVLVNWLVVGGYFGVLLSSYLLYLFLTKIELFLIILFYLEAFSIVFQSITLSNRLSINILAGSLLIQSLSI